MTTIPHNITPPKTNMETLSIRFTLENETPIDEYLQDGIISDYITNDDGSFTVIEKEVDEVLIESLRADELAEFFGIESEFVIAAEVLEFA
jgi:hypothetical protein